MCWRSDSAFTLPKKRFLSLPEFSACLKQLWSQDTWGYSKFSPPSPIAYAYG